MSNQVEIKNISKDINMDKLRGRSSIQSKAISRVMLAFSTTFLQPYVNRMEAQNNNPDWAQETDEVLFQLPNRSFIEGNLHNQNKDHNTSLQPNTYMEGDISINNSADQ